jgi:phage terminase large subunit-like protein
VSPSKPKSKTKSPRSPQKCAAPIVRTETTAPAFSYSATANEYAREVISGRIVACKWVQLACQRHIDDLARSRKGWIYAFDESKANRVCRFIEQLPHTKGDWAAKRENHIRLEPWQCFLQSSIYGWTQLRDGMRRFRIAYICVPRKNGKALALNTDVLTTSGWSTIGALAVGDQVYGPNGEPRKVTAATDVMYGHPCYEVEFSDGEIIVADAEHQWLTDSRRDRDRLQGRDRKTAGPKPCVKTTKEIAGTIWCRREVNHRISVASAIQLPEANLVVHPYVLGAWLGDGTSTCGEITIGPEDESAMLGNLRSCGESVLRKKSAACAFRITTGDRSQKARNISFSARLRKLGVLKNKHIPDSYLRASEVQRMALLQGLMDTDGSISKAGQCEYSTISAGLRDGVLELLRTLGFKASYIERRASIKGKDCGANYRIQFWAADTRPVFRLDRKRKRQRVLGIRSSNRQIVRCEETKSVPVRCIQVDAEDGLFLAGRTLVTTHNSIIAGGIGNYMFMADGEFGAEVYSGATSEKQAWEVFRPARQMIERTPRIKEVFGVHVGAKNMAILSNGSRFEPVIGKPGDGSSPSCAIVDEYHEHDTDELFDTMRTGMGARRQPLMLVITTAGSNVAGPCRALQSDVEKVLDGSIQRDELFGTIYTIDPEDDWTSEASLRKANPNYDVSVFGDFLKTEQANAVRDSRKQNVFLTKHLNIWVGASVAWMNMQSWNALADASLNPTEFLGLPCYAAVDLASKLDLTARVKVFKKLIAGKDHYYVFGQYYLPEERASEPELQHYQKWVHDGHLTTTPGNVIDYDTITADTVADVKKHKIIELGFDDWNAEQFAQQVAKESRATVIEVPFQVKTLSEPMKQVEALVIDGRIHHDGNPVLTWCMSNVVAHVDAKENIFPRKEKEENKIDGAVALIMAMCRALLGENKRSIYSSRGVLTL